VTTRSPRSGPAIDAGGKLQWLSLAACRSYDPSLFFPVGTTGPSIREIEKAKRICRGCEVQAECLQYALGNGAQHGIFGGLTEEERQRLRLREQRPIRRSIAQPAKGVPVPDHG